MTTQRVPNLDRLITIPGIAPTPASPTGTYRWATRGSIPAGGFNTGGWGIQARPTNQTANIIRVVFSRTDSDGASVPGTLESNELVTLTIASNDYGPYTPNDWGVFRNSISFQPTTSQLLQYVEPSGVPTPLGAGLILQIGDAGMQGTPGTDAVPLWAERRDFYADQLTNSLDVWAARIRKSTLHRPGRIRTPSQRG